MASGAIGVACAWRRNNGLAGACFATCADATFLAASTAMIVVGLEIDADRATTGLTRRASAVVVDHAVAVVIKAVADLCRSFASDVAFPAALVLDEVCVALASSVFEASSR